MLLVDTQAKTLVQDLELKTNISKSRPYGEWLKEQVNKLIECLLLEAKVFLIQKAF